MSSDRAVTESTVRPRYEPPSLRVMNEDEVLAAFQLTATQISAAGCWWSPAPTGCG
jgi:hypothetical protein